MQIVPTSTLYSLKNNKALFLFQQNNTIQYIVCPQIHLVMIRETNRTRRTVKNVTYKFK